VKYLRNNLVLGFRRLSTRGKKSIALYGASLIALACIDGLALILLSKIIDAANDSELSLSKDSTVTKMLVLVVVLFFTRSSLSIFISWKGMKDLSAEEVSIGDVNLASLDAYPWVVRNGFTMSDYYSAIDRGPYSLVQGLLVTFTTVVAELLSAVVILSVLLFVQPVTAVTAIAYFGVIAVLQHKVLSVSANKAGQLVAQKYSRVYEMLGNKSDFNKLFEVMPSISFVTELNLERKVLAESRAKLNFLAALPRYFMEAMLVIGFVVVSASTYVFSGSDKVLPSLVVFAAAGFRLLPIVNRIQGLILHLFGTAPLASEALIEKPDLKPARPSRESSQDTSAAVSVSDVSFSYGNNREPILNSISLELNRGKRYAIVGPSGAGKTTLVDIILGLLTPTSGSVKIAGDLRIAYVPQKTVVSGGSLLQNVAIEWNDENVDKLVATKSLEIARFPSAILELSESELRLSPVSGGELQRLGLARALYRNPTLLILDESTSALDAKTEQEVMDAVSGLEIGTTVVIVAHRLATIQDADEIIYLDSGKVLGIAPFEELKSLVPQFAEMVSLSSFMETPESDSEQA
jgi:ABC-type multidrug transport system fused ATPase/permease subunit